MVTKPLSPTQKQVLTKLTGGGFIRLARYSPPGGSHTEYLSLVNEAFAESGLGIAKASFKSLLASKLIELAKANPTDPFGLYYAISEAGKQALLHVDR